MEQFIFGWAKGIGMPGAVVLFGYILWKIDNRLTRLGTVLESLENTVDNLQTGKMWKNACEERHVAIKDTLENHEARIHDLEKERKSA